MNSTIKSLVVFACVYVTSAWAQAPSADAPETGETVQAAAEIGMPPESEDDENPSLLATLSHNSDFEQTAALYALLADAAIEDLERYVTEAKTIVSLSDRAAGLQIIYLRYLDLDPEGAVEHMLTAGTGLENNLVGALYFSWSKFDLDRAVRHSQTLPLAQHRQVAARAIVRANMHLDLDQLTELANRLGGTAAQELAGAQAEIIARMAIDDPQKGMGRLRGLAQSKRAELAHHVMHHWAEADAEGLLAYLLSDGAADFDSFARQAAVQSLAGKIPGKVLSEIDQIAHGTQERYTLITSTIGAIGNMDPDRALALARRIENQREREYAVRHLVMSLSYQNPDAAMAILDTLDDPRLIKAAAPQAVQMMAQQNLDKAVEMVQKFQDQAPQMVQQLASAMARTNPGVAVELAAELARTGSNPELQVHLIGSLADYDPVTAAALAEDLSPSMQKLDALKSIGNSWFNLDPDAAVAWALTQPPRASAEILQRVSNDVAQNNPQFAMGVVPLLPSNQLQNQWIGAIVLELSRSGSGREAVGWIDQYSDRPEHAQWIGQIAQFTANHSIEDALDIAELISEGASYENTVNSIIESWSARDVEAAAAWVGSLKNAEEHGAWVSSVAGHMARKDVAHAIQWVDGFRQSAERDPAYANILNSGYITSVQADRLMRKIMSPEMRLIALRSYLAQVARYDEREARLFLDRQTIDMDQKQALLDMIEGHRPNRSGVSRILVD